LAAVPGGTLAEQHFACEWRFLFASLAFSVPDSGNGQTPHVGGGADDEAHTLLAKSVYAPRIARMHDIFGDVDT